MLDATVGINGLIYTRVCVYKLQLSGSTLRLGNPLTESRIATLSGVTAFSKSGVTAFSKSGVTAFSRSGVTDEKTGQVTGGVKFVSIKTVFWPQVFIDDCYST